MKTFASLFSGGGGADIGALMAGFQPIWGIEKSPDIATIYATNLGLEPIIKSVDQVDSLRLEQPDVLWASPPCQEWSVARSKSLPPRNDADVGYAVIPFLTILQPKVFILENVEAYRKAHVFHAIVDALHHLGYWTSWEVLNAADFGVPQTRRRLILRAVKGGFVPPLPLAQKWCGWYSAIADLIPTLPESQFASWQVERMPELVETSLVDGRNTIRPCTVRGFIEPSPCVTAHWLHRPSITPRAFIVDGKNIYPGERLTIRDSEEPHFSITASLLDRPCNTLKAFIVDCQNNGRVKENGNRSLTIRRFNEPTFTIQALADRKPTRAWLEKGRVVVITPRALARFQTFPDSYQLPAKRTLACRVIGNAVPPIMAQKLLEGSEPVC